jgi:D-glycero-alpha-D-manno-heptose-7-phosphate kinase
VAADPDGAARLSEVPAGLAISEDWQAEQGVVAVAPLRIDLTGGFTDIPPFSSAVDSVHINAAFELHVRVSCRRRRDRLVRVSFAGDGSRAGGRVSDGRRHFIEAVRIGVAEFADDEGLELSISSQAPPGSGLGSSGAILVAAITGCAQLAGVSLSESVVAQKAIIAAAAAGIVGGEQDEFAAAHGSLRGYRFDRCGEVQIRDFGSTETCRGLEESLLVVQIGAGGRRTDVVADVVRAVRGGDQETVGALLRLQELALELFDEMSHGQFADLPKHFGRIRETQCALHPRMCCPVTAAAMEAVRKEIPELEYKILGGGGAGCCVLVHVPARDRLAATRLLKRRAKRVLSVRISPYGTLVQQLSGKYGFSR